MATPMTKAQLISQLKKWGVNYKEYPNWETHNRNHKGLWGPVNGFMWHHTGSDSKDQRGLLYNGYKELPGPLCHFGIAQDGTVWLIGWGRANHAGLGDDDVLNAVISERDLPVDNESNTDGNRHYYGAEFWYSGSHEMTDEQYYSGIKLSCAIIDFHNWRGESILGHGEWQTGKWDPGYASGKMMNMDNVRTDINEALKRGPKPVPTPPKPSPVTPKPSAVFNSVWHEDAMVPPKGHADNDNDFWWPENVLRLAAEQAEEANRKIERIMKHLGIE